MAGGAVNARPDTAAANRKKRLELQLIRLEPSLRVRRNSRLAVTAATGASAPGFHHQPIEPIEPPCVPLSASLASFAAFLSNARYPCMPKAPV